MSVVVFSPFAPPFIGGIEAHTKGLVEEISRYRKVVLYSHQSKPLIHESIETVYVDRFILAGRLPVPKKAIQQLVKMTAYLRINQPSLVIVQSHLFPLSLMALAAARFAKVKSLLVSHASGPIRDKNLIVSAGLSVYDYIMRLACRFFASNVVGVSIHAAKWISKQNSLVIPNSIPSALADCQIPPWEERRNTILMVGRLVEGKISKKIVQALLNCSFLDSIRIIGTGPEAKAIAEVAKEHSKLVLLGQLSRDKVFVEMRKSRFFVNISDYPDGLPTVLLEAAANGMFVCASGAGVSDVLGDEQLGLGLQPKNTTELIAFLEEKQDDIEFFTNRTNKLRARIASEFTWEVNGRKFLSFETG